MSESIYSKKERQMSILGTITLVASVAVSAYVTHRLVESKKLSKYRVLQFGLVATAGVLIIIGTLIGGQIVGIDMGTWVMYKGQYLLAPGGF